MVGSVGRNCVAAAPSVVVRYRSSTLAFGQAKRIRRYGGNWLVVCCEYRETHKQHG